MFSFAIPLLAILFTAGVVCCFIYMNAPINTRLERVMSVFVKIWLGLILTLSCTALIVVSFSIYLELEPKQPELFMSYGIIQQVHGETTLTLELDDGTTTTEIVGNTENFDIDGYYSFVFSDGVLLKAFQEVW